MVFNLVVGFEKVPIKDSDKLDAVILGDTLVVPAVGPWTPTQTLSMHHL